MSQIKVESTELGLPKEEVQERYYLTDKAPIDGGSARFGVIDRVTNGYVRYPDETVCYGMEADEALDCLLELRGVIFRNA